MHGKGDDTCPADTTFISAGLAVGTPLRLQVLHDIHINFQHAQITRIYSAIGVHSFITTM
jgi:hypothetical protein